MNSSEELRRQLLQLARQAPELPGWEPPTHWAVRVAAQGLAVRRQGDCLSVWARWCARTALVAAMAAATLTWVWSPASPNESLRNAAFFQAMDNHLHQP
jgi:hypothetical protein